MIPKHQGETTLECYSSKLGPGSVRSKGWPCGSTLTGGLPVGFLAVWAVVYVDVWGLLLFHSNTAERQETQTSLVFNNSECFPCNALGQLLLTS